MFTRICCVVDNSFNNGGLLFSSIVLVLIAVISLFSFLLLVESSQVVPASFGDIGGHLYGPWMRQAVLWSIAISQVGFVCAYMSFIATNLSPDEECAGRERHAPFLRFCVFATDCLYSSLIGKMFASPPSEKKKEKRTSLIAMSLA
jgi:amino acid permease